MPEYEDVPRGDVVGAHDGDLVVVRVRHAELALEHVQEAKGTHNLEGERERRVARASLTRLLRLDALGAPSEGVARAS